MTVLRSLSQGKLDANAAHLRSHRSKVGVSQCGPDWFSARVVVGLTPSSLVIARSALYRPLRRRWETDIRVCWSDRACLRVRPKGHGPNAGVECTNLKKIVH